MVIRKRILFGSTVTENPVPSSSGSIIKLQGMTNNTPTVLGFNKELLTSHVLLLGGTGSGKTNTMLHLVSQLKNAMGPDDIMLVFDTKLDFDIFQRTNDSVITYRDAKGKAYWNIFGEIVADGWDKANISANADEISELLFSKAIKDSGQPFFPMAARDTFSAILKAMCFLGANDKNYRIKHLKNSSLLQYTSIMDAEKLHSFLRNFPELSGVLKYIGDGTSDQALGVFAELQQVVSKAFSGQFSNVDGMFSVRQFVKQRGGRTLFIEYNPSNGISLQPIYSLITDMFLKEALNPLKNRKGHIYILLDEMKLLPQLMHLEDALNFGRSLGFSIIAGIQSMEQLYEVYGEIAGRNIASAFQTVICFRTNNEASRKYIKSLGGENMYVLQYAKSSGSSSEEKGTGCVIEDWDIASLKRGEAIACLPFHPPSKIQFTKFRG